MKLISAFDVIGPHMIGPSSSHTAGAVRLALLARKMIRGEIVSAHFILYGSFADTYQGHGTDRALVAGILGFEADDARIRDAFDHAKKAGLAYSFEPNHEDHDVHPNTVDIRIRVASGKEILVRGVSIGGGRAEIRGIDGVEIKLTGNYSTLFIKQRDEPGVAAHIAGVLGEEKINIAFLRLYREDKGQNAYTIVEADEEILPAVVHRIESHSAIHSAILIQ